MLVVLELPRLGKASVVGLLLLDPLAVDLAFPRSAAVDVLDARAPGLANPRRVALLGLGRVSGPGPLHVDPLGPLGAHAGRARPAEVLVRVLRLAGAEVGLAGGHPRVKLDGLGDVRRVLRSAVFVKPLLELGVLGVVVFLANLLAPLHDKGPRDEALQAVVVVVVLVAVGGVGRDHAAHQPHGRDFFAVALDFDAGRDHDQRLRAPAIEWGVHLLALVRTRRVVLLLPRRAVLDPQQLVAVAHRREFVGVHDHRDGVGRRDDQPEAPLDRVLVLVLQVVRRPVDVLADRPRRWRLDVDVDVQLHVVGGVGDAGRVRRLGRRRHRGGGRSGRGARHGLR